MMLVKIESNVELFFTTLSSTKPCRQPYLLHHFQLPIPNLCVWFVSLFYWCASLFYISSLFILLLIFCFTFFDLTLIKVKWKTNFIIHNYFCAVKCYFFFLLSIPYIILNGSMWLFRFQIQLLFYFVNMILLL